MKLLITALVLLYALPSVSQIEATTKDGRKVILNKNGTWKYVKTKAATATVVPPVTAVTVPVVASAANSMENLKKEAQEFSMQLIGTYFSEDCDAFFAKLSTEILSIESSGALILNEEQKNKLCQSIQRAVNDNSKTLQDYLNTYNLQLLTRPEVEAKAGRILPEHFNTTDAEFYVVGFEMKEGNTTSKFIWDDMFVFLVRKTEGAWKMKAFLGG